MRGALPRLPPGREGQVLGGAPAALLVGSPGPQPCRSGSDLGSVWRPARGSWSLAIFRKMGLSTLLTTPLKAHSRRIQSQEQIVVLRTHSLSQMDLLSSGVFVFSHVGV